MAYVTGAERLWLQTGIIQNAREMVREAISFRFGTVPEDIAREIDRFENKDLLKALHKKAILCSDLTVFRNALKEARC